MTISLRKCCWFHCLYCLPESQLPVQPATILGLDVLLPCGLDYSTSNILKYCKMNDKVRFCSSLKSSFPNSTASPNLLQIVKPYAPRLSYDGVLYFGNLSRFRTLSASPEWCSISTPRLCPARGQLHCQCNVAQRRCPCAGLVSSAATYSTATVISPCTPADHA